MVNFSMLLPSHRLAVGFQLALGVSAWARGLWPRPRAARRVPARLLGVALSQLVAQGGEGQLSLLESDGSTVETQRDRVISRMIDEVRQKFGPDALGRGRAQH